MPQMLFKLHRENIPDEWFVNFCPACLYSITFEKELVLEPQTPAEWNALAGEITEHECDAKGGKLMPQIEQCLLVCSGCGRCREVNPRVKK